MPETRWIVEYDGDKVTKIPYEVSDEVLAIEQKERRMAKVLDEIDELKVEVANLKKVERV